MISNFLKQMITNENKKALDDTNNFSQSINYLKLNDTPEQTHYIYSVIERTTNHIDDNENDDAYIAEHERSELAAMLFGTLSKRLLRTAPTRSATFH